MRLAVVIPSYKRPVEVVRCIDSLKRHRHLFPEFDVFVCTQAYKPEERLKVEWAHNDVKWLHYEKPLSPGGARFVLVNYVMGLQDISQRLFFSIDDDSEITEETRVLDVIREASKHKGVGIVALAMTRTHTALNLFKERPVLMTGGGMLFSPVVVKLAGNFRRDDFLDDAEFSLRVYLRGFKNYYTSIAKANPKLWREEGGKLEFAHKTKARSDIYHGLAKYVPPSVLKADVRETPTFAPNSLGRETHASNRNGLLRILGG